MIDDRNAESPAPQAASQTPARRPSELSAPLSGNRLDRADNLRRRPDALAQLRATPDARFLGLWRGKAPIRFGPTGPELLWMRPGPVLDGARAETPSFLGLDDGAGRFAADLSAAPDPDALASTPHLFSEPPKFIDLRSIGPELAAADAAVVAEAKSLLEWHANHPFCSKCGSPTALAQGGWRRDCPACGAHHFPRTDPVVIMLVVRAADPSAGILEPRVILGRQSAWPPGMMSLLAGYVEPGETIEEAVRRETWEESGVAVGEVRYLASQPWPFPSTLMIGCLAEAATDALTPDFEELEDCRWVEKSAVARALAGENPGFAAPRKDAIARMLLQAWVDGVV